MTLVHALSSEFDALVNTRKYKIAHPSYTRFHSALHTNAYIKCFVRLALAYVKGTFNYLHVLHHLLIYPPQGTAAWYV